MKKMIQTVMSILLAFWQGFFPVKNNLSNSSKYTVPTARYNQINNSQEKKSSVSGNHTYLPKTGEKTNKWLTWIGGGIFLVVSVGIFALKKRSHQPK
ncbi:LPXTG cell wall anchor domain-containing protein [Enterococcus faecium]|uniref:LPXTG cell wall anchor domain-containing protein n=1 Tax=Enterococcus faecium TaxID=1352 RepID=UPI000352EFD3|nr:LPXTG cell wall anchor domain-containing protein [Enterococcus faecium]EPI26258.1 LPXTG-motif protein cell wall anchor domain protein [Enterococcus faecium LA4B-2]